MLRVMVVDDEPMILGGIVSILKHQGLDLPLEIEKAGDGIEALEKAESFLPDLVITDIHMPEMNGFEMLEQLQDRGLCKKFILLTGYDDFEYARKAIRYQAIDYLLKPVNKPELIELVKKVSREKSKESETRKMTGLMKIREMIVNRAAPDEILIEKEELDALFGGGGRCHYTVIAVQTPSSLKKDETQAKLKRLLPLSYTFNSYYRNEIVVLAYGPEASLGELKHVRQELSESGCWTGISETAEDWEYLGGQYLQSLFEIFVQQHFPEMKAVKMPVDYRRQFEGYEALEHLVQTPHEGDRSELIKRYVGELSAHSGNRQQLFAAYLQTMFYLHLYLEIQGLNLKQLAGSLYNEEGTGYHHAEDLEWKLSAVIHQVLVAANLVPVPAQQRNQSIHKILQYIHEHYQGDFSLEQLAEMMELHPNYLSTLFKKETGSTFIHYLQTYRVDKAKELIRRSPEMSLEKIAAHVGFQHIGHFFRVFKKNTGCTPGQYRDDIIE